MQNDIQRSDGVMIGVLLGFDQGGAPLVIYPANQREEAAPARATIALEPRDVGTEVALLFEAGDPARPLVIGRIVRPALTGTHERDRIELHAEKEIVLRCGQASITLTSSGKVLIRGTYISSWSDGAHRIKGGSIHLN